MDPHASPEEVARSEVVLEKAEDNDHLFGFIRSATSANAQRIIAFDLAEFISNDYVADPGSDGARAADLAAVQDETCVAGDGVQVGECAPNGFYIRNNDPTEKSLAVSDSARFIIMNSSPTGTFLGEDGTWLPTEVSWEDFAWAINRFSAYGEWTPPYRLALEGGRVVRIEEVYIS
jgi:hypothetical protein